MDPKQTEWSPHRVWVPTETKVDMLRTAFRTHDKEVYVRSTHTGQIRHAQPKVKGKAARKADKARRREMREHLGKTLTVTAEL